MVVDQLRVEIHADRAALGQAAADAATGSISDIVEAQGAAAVVFAAAPSQNETHAALRARPGIDWRRVTALHLDEYAGMSRDHPASFRRFLRRSLFDHLPVREFHELQGDATDLDRECKRYSALLRDLAPQLCLLGIGENGHLAFNDPPVDFNDPQDVKVVELDEVCRNQQVHDGCFPALDDVPPQALTLTVPAIMRIPRLVVVVPGPAKAPAVRAALRGVIAPECPASILRRHPNATLFLDRDSASLLG
jgi:glucosamine-6-phosphate deaminase